MEVLPTFFCGLLGGFFTEVLYWYKIRAVPEDQRYLLVKSLSYWVPTVLMILGGGILTVIHGTSGATLTPLTALNLGASAPLAFSAIVSQTDRISPGAIDAEVEETTIAPDADAKPQ